MPNKYSDEYINSTIKGLSESSKYLQRYFFKKKTSLVEMIVYGRITNTFDTNKREDISIKEANKIIKKIKNNVGVIAWIQ